MILGPVVVQDHFTFLKFGPVFWKKALFVPGFNFCIFKYVQVFKIAVNQQKGVRSNYYPTVYGYKF